MLHSKIELGNRSIGGIEDACFIIAEAGVNHNGDIGLAKELVDCAADSGADAVKFQSFRASDISSQYSRKAKYHLETTGTDSHQSWFDLLKSQELSVDMHLELAEKCASRNIIFSSTPYDFFSLNLLKEMRVAFLKIASCDLNNRPLLEAVAETGIPMILSTAMSELAEVEKAISWITTRGASQVGILQCTGDYPSPLNSANLAVMDEYVAKFGCPAGFSDHTEGMVAGIAAIARGAKIYERHFTLDRKLPGPDHRMSLMPDELTTLISALRDAESAVGSSLKSVLELERCNRVLLRKSICANRSLEKGHKLSEADLCIKRPGSGIAPELWDDCIGSILTHSVGKDQPLELNWLS